MLNNKNQAAQRLIELKERIEKKKERFLKVRTQQEMLLRELKEKYSCSSIDEASSSLAKIEKDILKKRKEFDELCLTIEQEMMELKEEKL